MSAFKSTATLTAVTDTDIKMFAVVAMSLFGALQLLAEGATVTAAAATVTGYEALAVDFGDADPAMGNSYNDIQMGGMRNKEWDVDSSADDIRCFCNMPKCITAGYMCRTARNRHGGCYWEQRPGRGQSTRDTLHGCLELLKDEYIEPKCNHTLRPARTGSASSARSATRQPVLLCCQEDMCNHVDRPDHQRAVADNEHYNNIAFLNRTPPTQIEHKPTQMQSSAGPNVANADAATFLEKHLRTDARSGNIVAAYESAGTAGGQSDGWIRAASIIFPIAGGVILLVLIALAMRILRKDIDHDGLEAGAYSAPIKQHPGAGGGGGKHLDMDAAYTINHHHQHHDLYVHQQHQQHQQQLSDQHHLNGSVHGPLLLDHDHHQHTTNNYRKTSAGLPTGPSSLITNDLKSVALGKKSHHSKTFEYSLLPQRCYDPSKMGGKSNNALVAPQQPQIVGDVNLSGRTGELSGPAAAFSDAKDYKVYEKASLSATPYWTTTTKMG